MAARWFFPNFFRRRCSGASSTLGVLLTLTPALSCAATAQTATDVSDPIRLPLPVSDYFTPTGAYGDAATPGIVQVTSGCDSRAPAPGGPVGDCYVVSYGTPSAGYAGVFWQFPANNWGNGQGRRVSPGATRATFYARVDGPAPVTVTFGVGGICDPACTQGSYADTIDSKAPIKLTNDWQTYSVPITGTYDWVLSAFSWECTTVSPVVFYIDSIQWQ
jgi:hypothetical protein